MPPNLIDACREDRPAEIAADDLRGRAPIERDKFWLTRDFRWEGAFVCAMGRGDDLLGVIGDANLRLREAVADVE